jgi:hypothetical protein
LDDRRRGRRLTIWQLRKSKVGMCVCMRVARLQKVSAVSAGRHRVPRCAQIDNRAMRPRKFSTTIPGRSIITASCVNSGSVGIYKNDKEERDTAMKQVITVSDYAITYRTLNVERTLNLDRVTREARGTGTDTVPSCLHPQR